MSFVFVCWHNVKKKKSKCNSVELGDQVAINMSGITDTAVRVSTIWAHRLCFHCLLIDIYVNQYKYKMQIKLQETINTIGLQIYV